jgi:quercetin dioxygenase-like cupin family protein
VGTYRLYSGSDGQSQIEPIDISKTPEWTSGLDVTKITFRTAPVGRFSDWHPAPRRQFVIVLSGQLEIGLGDGSKHVFGPGDARLVEDLTGKGHTTAVHGNEPCTTATVTLPHQSTAATA